MGPSNRCRLTVALGELGLSRAALVQLDSLEGQAEVAHEHRTLIATPLLSHNNF